MCMFEWRNLTYGRSQWIIYVKLINKKVWYRYTMTDAKLYEYPGIHQLYTMA